MTTNYNFIGNRNRAFVLSGILFLVTFVLIVIINKGMNYSIDFVGGTSLQIQFDNDISNEMATLKNALNNLEYGTPEVKVLGNSGNNVGTELQINVKTVTTGASEAKATDVGDAIKQTIKEAVPNQSFEISQSSEVGPRVGSELKSAALKAILISFLFIVIYIGIRFHLPYGIAAIVALVHDVVITLGFFAFAAKAWGWEISLPVIAAILTIVGYSLNDTIVVFDRIRENNKAAGKNESFADIVNASINQTLTRTLITSLTTFLVVLSIFIAFANSGNVLETFTGALIVGIISGTYSSIFIASPILVLWNRKWPIDK